MHTTSKFSAYISSLLKEKCQKQILSVLFIDGDDKRAREAALYFKKNNLAKTNYAFGKWISSCWWWPRKHYFKQGRRVN
nr:hypothetical protein [Mycoplasmopsis bovis]